MNYAGDRRFVGANYASNFGYAVSVARNQYLIEQYIRPMVGVSSLAAVASSTVLSNSFHTKLWSINPFSHVNAIAIADGSKFIASQIKLYQTIPSLLIMLVWTLIFFILTSLRMSAQRDML